MSRVVLPIELTEFEASQMHAALTLILDDREYYGDVFCGPRWAGLQRSKDKLAWWIRKVNQRT